MSADRQWLLSLRQPIADFLQQLGLQVSHGKTVICDVRQGVEFLGAFLKPRRRYVSHTTLQRMQRKLPDVAACDHPHRLRSRVNSMLGLLAHYRSYHLRRRLFLGMENAWRWGYFLRGMRKYVLFPCCCREK